MRLPTDSTLLLGPGADPALHEAWLQEGLPVQLLPCAEADLDALPTATIIAAGQGAQEAAGAAARLGFRVFLVGGPAGPGVGSATVRQILSAASLVRLRERTKAARRAVS